MNLFNDKDGKFKRLEKIILDIEKEKHTISWAHTTIQSCLWNLEKSPNLTKFDLGVAGLPCDTPGSLSSPLSTYY